MTGGRTGDPAGDPAGGQRGDEEASTMDEHDSHDSHDSHDDTSRATRAVVDRIVDGEHAVLLVEVGRSADDTDEADAREVEVVLPAALLPEGAAEGDWLRLDLTLDAVRTQERRESIEERLARIREERGGSRFV